MTAPISRWYRWPQLQTALPSASKPNLILSIVVRDEMRRNGGVLQARQEVPLVHCNTKGALFQRSRALESNTGNEVTHPRPGWPAAASAAEPWPARPPPRRAPRGAGCCPRSRSSCNTQQRVSAGRSQGLGRRTTHLQISAASAPSLVTSVRQNSCTCNDTGPLYSMPSVTSFLDCRSVRTHLVDDLVGELCVLSLAAEGKLVLRLAVRYLVEAKPFDGRLE